MIAAAPPLALYVHLPWCVRKCPYCDFNSHVVPAAGIPRQAYLAALLEDLEFAAGGLGGRPLVSVFFGGGTPSLVEASAIGRIVERARELFPASTDLEVTLEANPGTVEHGRFTEYRDAGVNRVSLGAQSFDDRQLAALGRIHAAADTLAAVAELRAAGMDNFNLDLMYALPRQSPEDALRDVECAIELAPAHVSHYQLTLEPGTAFERRPPPLPDDETSLAMQLASQQRLADAGYPQYEVSAYAHPGRQCLHNLNYWRYGDYVGVGAGAHGKVTDTATGAVVRTARVRQPGRYLAAVRPEDRIEETRTVATRELPFEFCLNALRLVEGFDAAMFEARTGLAWRSIEAPLATAVARGLIATTQGRWVPTAFGQRFLNDLQALFLPEGAPAHAAMDDSAIASGARMV
ncbi:MAG: radical SAM family heme chaperone HemW [Steroidobacteraceae bacterium]